MDTIFMNSENSKTFDPHRLLLNLSGKIYLKRSHRYVALSHLFLIDRLLFIRYFTQRF